MSFDLGELRGDGFNLHQVYYVITM